MRIRHTKVYYRFNSKRIYFVYVLPLIIPVLFFSARYSYQKGVEEHLYDNEQINGIVSGAHYQEIGPTNFECRALIVELEDGRTCAVSDEYFSLFKRNRTEFFSSVIPNTEISLIINKYRTIGVFGKKPRVMQIIYNDVCYLSIDDVLDYELRERTLWSKISPLLLSIVFVIPLEWYMHQTIVGWSKMEKSWHKQREQFLRRHGGH